MGLLSLVFPLSIFSLPASNTSAAKVTDSRPPMASLHSPAFFSHSSSPTCHPSPFSLSSLPLLSARRSATADIRPASFRSSLRASIFSSSPIRLCIKNRPKVSCAVSLANGQPDEPSRLNLEDMMERARKYSDKLPQPIKTFPWDRALWNFIQLILDLTAFVIKYLSVPFLAVTSLGEMSYCAYQRKLGLVPIPLIIGFTLAGILRHAALELTPRLKDAKVPWHLLGIATFFLLLKLPGPYYPYWGRIFIPHLANGGLLRTLWITYRWYK